MSGLGLILPPGGSDPIAWQVGVWYDTQSYLGGVTTTGALTANRVYASPLWIPEPCVLDRIGFTIPSGAASTGKVARLMLALPTSGDLPGALLLDAGTVAADSTGDKEITINQAVGRGLLYALIASDGTPTVNLLNNYGVAAYGKATPAASAIQGSPYKTQANIVAPDPFGTPTAYSTNVYISVAVRKAS